VTIAVVEANGGIAQVLSSIAQLLWPIVALILAYWLLPELKQILHRISESRNLKVKWGDKELSVQEAADNLQRVVGSLIETEAARGSAQDKGIATDTTTSKVIAAGKGVSSVVPPDDQLSEVARVAASPLPRRILWVDDKPEGNALEMASLKDRGVQIDAALSTEEALRLFEPHKYALVVTDMYRREEGIKNADAGIDLLKELRSIDPSVVVIAYCAPASVRGYGSFFLKEGGNAITASPILLFEQLNRYLPRA